jgi:hypothetical protein
VAGSLSSTNAAPQLRPLSEVLAAGSADVATMSYFTLRCTAVLLAAADELKADGTPDMAPMETKFRDQSRRFFVEMIDLSTAPEESRAQTAIDNVLSVSALYDNEMRANFFATGNRFEGLVAADIQLCTSAAQTGGR